MQTFFLNVWQSYSRGCTLKSKIYAPIMAYLKSTKIALRISSLSNRQCSFENRSSIQKSNDFVAANSIAIIR